jgi:hypothetical protein
LSFESHMRFPEQAARPASMLSPEARSKPTQRR